MKQRGNFGIVVICHETVWNGATEQKEQLGSCNTLQLTEYQEGRQSYLEVSCG